MLWCRQLEDSYTNIAKSYKKCKEKGWDNIIDDDMLKIVAKGGYIHDNGLKGVEKGYKPYYEYLKYGNKGGDNNMSYAFEKDFDVITEKIKYDAVYKPAAELYLSSNNKENLSDDTLKFIAKGGYISDNGFDDVEEGYKPYFDYLKYGNKPQQQEEVKEEPIMIEDNYNYETPYSFEYEPYLLDNNNYSITFDHEVDTSNTMEIIEEMYNEDNNIEDIDSDDVINIMDILSNKVKEVKKHIIHYISNYRPIMNQYTGDIDTILIE